MIRLGCAQPKCSGRRLRPSQARRLHVVRTAENDGREFRNNKLNIPKEALAELAGGLHGEPSRLNTDILTQIADLPMTDGLVQYRVRSGALQQWKSALQKGVLPYSSRVDFPAEPFKTKFLDALSKLEMPRFTRRYPNLADALLQEMLVLTRDFELELLEMQAQAQQPKRKEFQPQNGGGPTEEQEDMEDGMANGADSSNANQDGQDQEKDGDEPTVRTYTCVCDALSTAKPRGAQ